MYKPLVVFHQAFSWKIHITLYYIKLFIVYKVSHRDMTNVTTTRAEISIHFALFPEISVRRLFCYKYVFGIFELK